ncbi:MAG TPA: hypothetical protein DCZ10_09770 [Pelotomaculum sp.]|nr:hypothetical protein [Pelotomaculum sp.]
MCHLGNEKKINVIIGNSAAGVSAIKEIRNYDSQCSIILISKEDCKAYSPVLEPYYIAQKIDRCGMFFVDDNFFEDYNVSPLLGIKAIEVDPIAKQVKLENGKYVQFDNLLIATGSSPRRLGLEGEDLPGIFTLKSISDSDRILEYSAQVKDIVVIGGGFIGLHAAKALHKTGRKITLMEISNKLLSQNIDERCSSLFEDIIKKAGVSIIFGKGVKSFYRKNNRIKIQLNSGETLDTEMVVMGTGVQPNIDLVKNSQIKTNRGIVVDESMRTNFPNIFAAGDVAEGPNLITAKNSIVPNWINACGQGTTAGSNMSGGFSTYQSLDELATNIFGLAIAVLGNSSPTDGFSDESSYFNFAKGIYRKIHFNEKGELDGAILVGQASDVGIISNLIRRRVAISRELRDQIACNINPLSIWNYINLGGYEA